MLTKEQINKRYVDYKVYNVLKLKDKYGFKIVLYFNDESEEVRQIGGFSKKSDAQKERDKVITQLANHTFVVIPRIKSNEFFEYWLTEIKAPILTYNSYLSYRNAIRNYIIPFFDNLYLSQIGIGHIQKLYNSVLEQYESITKMVKTVIIDALNYAKDKNLIDINPAASVSLPKSIEGSSYKTLEIDIDKTLSVEQVKLLIEKSKETPIHLHILFAVLMGLRKQEINGLKYSDVDYVNGKLYVQRQLGVDPHVNKEELKKKTYTTQEIKLKTHNSKRALDIPDMVMDAILEEKLKYERNKNRRKNDKNDPFRDLGYICCSTHGKPRSKGFHKKYYDSLLEENNLPKIKFHDLRHTYTTLLLMNNYNLKAISQILGHASTIITVGTYFDKNKIVIDCTEELNRYIDQVQPKENNDAENVLDLDTNFIINKYVS